MVDKDIELEFTLKKVHDLPNAQVLSVESLLSVARLFFPQTPVYRVSLSLFHTCVYTHTHTHTHTHTLQLGPLGSVET